MTTGRYSSCGFIERRAPFQAGTRARGELLVRATIREAAPPRRSPAQRTPMTVGANVGDDGSSKTYA
jgi:hypothetical protein